MSLFLIFLFSAIPIVLWYLPGQEITESNIFLQGGRIAGLTGASLFSLNFILSSRLQIIDKIFRGLNRVYISHHLLGAVSFILLLFHPLSLAINLIPISIKLAADSLLPSTNNIPVNFGILALTTLIILLVITFFIPLAYEKWKTTHKYLGFALILASFHIFLIPSDVSSNFLLRVYFIILLSISTLIFLYKSVFGKFFVKQYKYEVEKVSPLNNSTTEIIIKPKNNKMNFKPGQFAFFSFTSLGISKEQHPFSITSIPKDNHLSISVKSLGDFTETLKLLKPGSAVSVEGPFGSFTYLNVRSTNQIWIAGGIGITPFLSMVNNLPENDQYKIDLYYSVREQEEAVYLEKFEQISKDLKNFRLFPNYSNKQGKLTAQFILDNSKVQKDVDIFICGPLIMMQSLRKQFNNLGIPNSKIHTEEFALF